MTQGVTYAASQGASNGQSSGTRMSFWRYFFKAKQSNCVLNPSKELEFVGSENSAVYVGAPDEMHTIQERTETSEN